MNDQDKKLIDAFHVMYYHNHRGDPPTAVWADTTWMGCRVHKNPMDLWSYQELIFNTQPQVIIETGVHQGGSILYFATLGMLLGVQQVIGIDIELMESAQAMNNIKNVNLIEGSSTDDAVLAQVRDLVAGRPALVLLDSDHARDHVLAEMKLYNEFVPVGGYMIVEDANVNSHPVYPTHGPGPYEAIESFLAENNDFEIDKERCEKFYLSFNPNGYLKRVK